MMLPRTPAMPTAGVLCLFFVVLLIAGGSSAFSPSTSQPQHLAIARSRPSFFSSLTAPSSSVQHRRDMPFTALALSSSGKGFGGGAPEPTKKKKPEQPPATAAGEPAVAQQQQRSAAPEPAAAAAAAAREELNPGQKALEELRRKRAGQKDDELRQIRELKASDKQVQEAPAVIPERVAVRMGKRMVPFVALPLFLSTGSFVAFWYLSTVKNLEFQPGLVAGVSSTLLVVGLLGITYSLMSASWDEDREGDLLGGDEFKKNIQNVQEGLSRSRDNIVLREKMAGLDDSEIGSALDDLNRREAAESRRQQSLQDKLKDELD